MALVNIIAKSNNEIKWDIFLNEYSKLKLKEIEVFPIPKELGFIEDSIGISVHQGYVDKKNVIRELKVLVDFCIAFQLIMMELYDNIEISSHNVDNLFDNLLN